jgi:hypothetical protein
MKRLLPILLLLPTFAAGNIAFNVTAPTAQSTLPGGSPNPNCVNGSLSCLIFSGNIVPDVANDTYINGIQVAFSPLSAGLASNDNFFFANVPGFLASFDPTYSGPIFEIDVDTTVSLGLYTGTVTLLGGTNGPADLLPLAADNFSIMVTPEATTVWLTASGLLILGLLRRRAVTNSRPQTS